LLSPSSTRHCRAISWSLHIDHSGSFSSVMTDRRLSRARARRRAHSLSRQRWQGTLRHCAGIACNSACRLLGGWQSRQVARACGNDSEDTTP
jgi:hypothetical protein